MDLKEYEPTTNVGKAFKELADLIIDAFKHIRRLSDNDIATSKCATQQEESLGRVIDIQAKMLDRLTAIEKRITLSEGDK